MSKICPMNTLQQVKSKVCQPETIYLASQVQETRASEDNFPVTRNKSACYITSRKITLEILCNTLTPIYNH